MVLEEVVGIRLGRQRDEFVPHRPEDIRADDEIGLPPVDLAEVVEIGDGDRLDVFLAMSRGIFRQILQILEHVLGAVEMVGVAVLVEHGRHPVRVLRDDHAADRTKILGRRSGDAGNTTLGTGAGGKRQNPEQAGQPEQAAKGKHQPAFCSAIFLRRSARFLRIIATSSAMPR